MRRRNAVLLGLLGLGILLLAARLALPYVVEDYINGRLAAMQSYQGRIERVHLALWRGAYRVDGVRIEKRGGDAQRPFFVSHHIDLSVEWRSLFKGAVVGQGSFDRPILNLVQGRSEEQTQLGKEVNWRQQLEGLLPIRFNTIAIHDGTVTFRAPGIQTQDALVARRVEGTLSNLTNVVQKNKEAFADFNIVASVLDTGAARINGGLDPWADTPTFDVNLTVEKVRLPEVNPWLREYLKADAASGDFELYLEVAAADGRFQGYAKPLMHDVNLHGSEDEGKPALKRFWEGVVNFAAKVFENKEKDQIGARIPFSGTIENPKAGLFQALVSVLHNAFVGAFANSLEDSISIHTVEKGLKKFELKDTEQHPDAEAKGSSESRKAEPRTK